MAKNTSIYFHAEKNGKQEIPTFIPVNYWESIGADTLKKHPDSYYFKLLKIAVSKPHIKTEEEARLELEEDVLIEMWYDNYYKDTPDDYLKNTDSIENIVNNYPPHIQKISRLYFKIFEIEVFDIPNPHANKDGFGYWCKDLEKIKTIGGQYLSDGLVRAKRNYDNRHDKGFELTHPGTIFKILKSALEEIEMERKMLFVPDDNEEKKITERSSLTKMRSILE